MSHLNLHYSSAVMSGLWFTLRGSPQCLWLAYTATEEAAIKRVSNVLTPPFSEKPQMSCVIGICSWVQGLDGILTLSLGEIKGARGMHTNQVLSQQGNISTQYSSSQLPSMSILGLPELIKLQPILTLN